MASRINRLGLVVLLSGFSLIAAMAQDATNWQIDKSQSAVNFSINNFFVSVKGQFTEFDGDISFDPNNLKNSNARFTIPIKSINTGNDTRDKHLQVENFFDAETYPEMIFQSSKFEQHSDKEFLVYGKLTIKDQTKDVVLPMKIISKMNGANTLSVEIDTAIDRKDYGVGTGVWSVTVSIGNEVKIHIPLELSRKSNL